MTVARSAADVLAEHVTLEVECIDRMYLNVYVPKLMYPAGVVGFFRGHRGQPFASGALMDPITRRFVASVHRYVRDHGIDMVAFAKGERKDDVMAGRLAGHDGSEGVLFVGRAQEKCRVFRTERRTNPVSGVRYPFIVAATAVVNQFYFYIVDDDFGPLFLKFCSYFPYTAKLCVNVHHWAQRQAAKAGIGFEALDNGFVSCDDPERLQAICASFGADQVRGLLAKWLDRLPQPLEEEDRVAGYGYACSILQAEFSLTQVLDRPGAGRVFFEEVIRDNLDAGRPDRVSLIFERQVRTKGARRTPSRYRTRVITSGVTPSIHVEFKHSKIKQYFKLGRAIRTETTINDTYDFGIGRGLANLAALAAIGYRANRRLQDAQRVASADPMTGAAAYEQVCKPIVVEGQRVPPLRFDQPLTEALLAALVIFRANPDGFSNRELRDTLAPILGVTPTSMTPGAMTYHLRRLRCHGLIVRTAHTHRYKVTLTGLRAALVLSRCHDRLLWPAMAAITPGAARTSPIGRALDTITAEIDRAARQAHLATAA